MPLEFGPPFLGVALILVESGTRWQSGQVEATTATEPHSLLAIGAAGALPLDREGVAIAPFPYECHDGSNSYHGCKPPFLSPHGWRWGGERVAFGWRRTG